MAKFHDLTMNSLAGEPVKFSTFKGKTVLVVNVASRCGLTPQYAGLRALQEANVKKNFTVLGFPCNQFGAQEPGTPEEIHPPRSAARKDRVPTRTLFLLTPGLPRRRSRNRSLPAAISRPSSSPGKAHYDAQACSV